MMFSKAGPCCLLFSRCWRWRLDWYTGRGKQGEYVPASSFAISHAHLGEKDEAFKWLEKAFENYGPSYLKVDPLWDPLRDDPRFQDLLLRMNLAP